MESLTAPPLALPEPAVEASAPSVWPPVQQTWFRAASEKGGCPVSVRVEALSMYPFWTPNPGGITWCLVQDIDEADGLARAFDPALPPPHWIVENPLTGHVQVGHVIDAVIHTEAALAAGHTAPMRYLGAVTRAMARAYGADPCFTGQRCRNPLYAEARSWTRQDLPAYGLRELHEALADAGLWDPSPVEAVAGAAGLPDVPAGVVATEGDRNQTVFDVCRLAAYRGEDHRAAAYAVHCVPPLPVAEVEGIIRSVEAYMGRTGRRVEGGPAMSEAHRAVQAERGRRGGSVGSDAQTAALARGRAAGVVVRSMRAVGQAAEIVRLHEEGLTRRRIMAALGCSESTVKRSLRAARATQDDAESMGGGGGHDRSLRYKPARAALPLVEPDTPAPPPEPPERGHPSHPTPTRDDRPTPRERTEHDEPVHRPEPAARPVDRRGRARAEAAAPEAEAHAVACDPCAGRGGAEGVGRDPASGSCGDAQRGDDDGGSRRGDGRER